MGIRISTLTRAKYVVASAVLVATSAPFAALIPSGSAAAATGCIGDYDELKAAVLAEASPIRFCEGQEITATDDVVISYNTVMNLNGGTLNGKIVAESGSVAIRNGAVNNDVRAIVNKGADLTLRNVTATSATRAAVYSNDAAATTTIVSGTYTGATYAVNSGAGEIVVKGGAYSADPTAYLANGLDTYTTGEPTYWVVGPESSLVAADTITAAVGERVELFRGKSAELSEFSYTVLNSNGADVSGDVTIETETEGDEVVGYVTALKQNRKEIDITNNSGDRAHVTFKAYNINGPTNAVVKAGEDYAPEISSSKWNMDWSLASGDEAVVTVAEDGKTLHAEAAGTATVTAMFDDTVGSTYNFTVNVYDLDETPMEILIAKDEVAEIATDSNWDVEIGQYDEGVITVDEKEDGKNKITGVGAGKTEVDFSITVGEDTFTKTVTAHVYEIVPTEQWVPVGESLNSVDWSEVVKADDEVEYTVKIGAATADYAEIVDGVIYGTAAGDANIRAVLTLGDTGINKKAGVVHVYDFVSDYATEYDVIAGDRIRFNAKENNPNSEVIVEGDFGARDRGDGKFVVRIPENTVGGTYTMQVTDVVAGSAVSVETITIRVHELVVNGEDGRYIVLTSNPFNQQQNRIEFNVTEKSGFTASRNITATVSDEFGIKAEYRHQGNWRITGLKAGSYTITFSDGYASADVTVYVMDFSFGQNSYHVRAEDGESSYALIKAINDYWHDVNAEEGRIDTSFVMVNDETGEEVASGYDVDKSARPTAEGEDYKFHWCGDGGCLEAGDYTVTFSASANGAVRATKSVRLHVYEMVTPWYDTRYVQTGNTIDVDVYDRNDRATIAAEVVDGDADGIRFETSGFGIWATTDYTQIEVLEPGVYTVRYTDRMGNGEIGGTYDLRIVAIEIEEETLLVRKGATIEITGSSAWDASMAVDDESGIDYTAEENENGEMVIVFDSTDAELGEHTFYVGHDFVEFDAEFPAREDIKIATVIVYEISSDAVSDPEEVTASTIEDLLDTLNEEGLADDLMESSFFRLWQLAAREDVRELFGDDVWSNFFTLRELRDAIAGGEAISTFVEVYEYTEEEVADWVDEDLKNLVKLINEDGAKYYDITVLLIAGEGEEARPIGALHQLNDTITVYVADAEAPEAGYSRQYFVVRQHGDEEPEILVEGEGFFVEDGKIYIISDRFSTFAVTYADTVIPAAPDTGALAVASLEGEAEMTATVVALVATTLAAVLMMVGAVEFAKRR